MLSLQKLLGIAVVVAATAAAQPALTNIQDVLYRADGTRFSGTVYITYHSFQAGDTSNIATANLVLPIVNGTLRTRLVPTTTASGGAQYQITYNSRGVDQFTEVWAVPPTSMTLRVRDVRLSSSTVVGPAAVTTPIQIGDVIGLTNELDVRPMRGVGFAIGRAAVINSAGQIDGAAGSLSDCVRVDGSSGPCGGGSGGGGTSGLFSDGEVPVGTVNSSNTVFMLLHAPAPSGSLELFRNGLLMRNGTDYTLNTSTVTFFVASTPQSGDLLTSSYRYADANPLGALAGPQVICSGVGANTSAITSTQLATCTIPTGSLSTGDRLEVRFQFGHTGTSQGFTAEVRVGSTMVIIRPAGATESLLAGHSDFGLFSGGQSWDSQNWGVVTAAATGAGVAAEDASQSIIIQFRGQMAAASADTIGVRNFTVVRYAAQANP